MQINAKKLGGYETRIRSSTVGKCWVCMGLFHARASRWKAVMTSQTTFMTSGFRSIEGSEWDNWEWDWWRDVTSQLQQNTQIRKKNNYAKTESKVANLLSQSIVTVISNALIALMNLKEWHHTSTSLKYEFMGKEEAPISWHAWNL